MVAGNQSTMGIVHVTSRTRSGIVDSGSRSKNVLKWTRLSCREFEDNQVKLQFFVLAYNLANFLRRLGLPRSIRHCTLTTLREKLVKIGAKVVKHSRYAIFQLAEAAIPSELFAMILS